MKIRRGVLVAGTVLLSATAGGAWFYQRADASALPAYRTAAIERADLRSTVSATGALSAVRTVQVGTQVSGQVAEIFVDFNDRVKKGQLLARIDPTLQEAAVEEAQAGLERAQAQLTQARGEYERQKQLHDAKIVTASEFSATEANYRVGQAQLRSAEIALNRARQNLGYTRIYSPIDGVIVERNVDVGQTVAASLSAPQLFLIANDLTQMQILASVDESDIGSIREGQPVTFTVQSYQNQSFTGTVQQVRLQSTTQDNVVNYTAVVSVQNPNGRLLPGMTATVEFETAMAADALTVPNAALRIRPTEEMLAAAGASGSTSREQGGARQAGAPADSAARGAAGGARTRAPGGRTGQPRGSGATLWLVDGAGRLTSKRVRTGISDGQRTQVIAEGLAEGTQVVTSVPSAGSSGSTGSAPAGSNPLQPQRPRGGPAMRF